MIGLFSTITACLVDPDGVLTSSTAAPHLRAAGATSQAVPRRRGSEDVTLFTHQDHTARVGGSSRLTVLAELLEVRG